MLFSVKGAYPQGGMSIIRKHSGPGRHRAHQSPGCQHWGSQRQETSPDSPCEHQQSNTPKTQASNNHNNNNNSNNGNNIPIKYIYVYIICIYLSVLVYCMQLSIQQLGPTISDVLDGLVPGLPCRPLADAEAALQLSEAGLAGHRLDRRLQVAQAAPGLQEVTEGPPACHGSYQNKT